MRKQKGITLIALVITIIILIILAAVSVNLVLGENGILQRAQSGTKEYNIKVAQEAMEIKITGIDMKYGGKATLQQLADELCEDEEVEYVRKITKTASLEKVILGELDSIATKLKAYEYEFEINRENNIKCTSISASETPGTATAEDIVKGKTAWVNGKLITGTMEVTTSNITYVGDTNDRNGVTFDIKTSYPNNYQDLTVDDFKLVSIASSVRDAGHISMDAGWAYVYGNYVGGSITYNATTGELVAKAPYVYLSYANQSSPSISMYGQGVRTINASVLCTATIVEDTTDLEGTPTTAEDIVKGKTAWVNGELITGTMEVTTSNITFIGDTNTQNGVTFDIKTNYPNDYQNLTVDDFILVPTVSSISDAGHISFDGGWAYVYANYVGGVINYNPETGELVAKSPYVYLNFVNENSPSGGMYGQSIRPISSSVYCKK